MKKTIVFRFAVSYLAVVGVLSVLNLLFTFGVLRDSQRQTLSRSLSEFNRALMPSVREHLERGDRRGLDALVKSLHAPEGPRITVIAPSGIVIADSDEETATLDNHRDRPEIREALAGRTGESFRYSTTVGQHLLYVADPVMTDGAAAGAVRSSKYLVEMNRVMRSFLAHLAGGLSLLALATALLGVMLARTFTRPFRDLKTGFGKLAAGDFTVRMPYSRRDEIGELADRFNAMAGRTEAMFGRLAAQKGELDAVIRAIPDGLCVCDGEGRVVMHNEAWASIVGQAESGGRFYWELVRADAFVAMTKKAYAEDALCSAEFRAGERDYHGIAAPLASANEMLIILHDITGIRELDRKKRDLVANVSHELRTPLTAIKGYAETIEVPDEEGRHYLDIIKRNTDRLIALVNDMAVLSRMEEAGPDAAYRPVDLTATLADALKIFEPRLKQKGLSLRVEAGPALSVEGDAFMLEQMLVNLIDNAVKYTETGGITVGLERQAAGVKITVRDTGIGIPAEHVGRIFDRFHVVDRARSRESGGTGLGLSIVKHIVAAHDGTVSVESVPGQGSVFTVILPSVPFSRFGSGPV